MQDGETTAMKPAGGSAAGPGGRGLSQLFAGRYEVGAVLGRGGMGEVRAGHDRRLGRDVAVKVLRPDMACDPAIRERFEHEARLAARLVHPHVVAVFDTGEHDGVPFLVMERLSGRTLADAIAAGPMDAETVRAIGVQILDALDAAHSAGLVHRDVKPGNVLAAAPGTWKVGDFGIAKSLEVGDPSLTLAGLIVGTPVYLAPERLAGGPATVTTDLYAVGAVLYEALSGRRPVDPSASLSAMLTATPTPLTDLRPDVPAGLAGAVASAMDRDPARRYASAAGMAGALRAPEPLPAVPTQTVAMAVPASTAPTQGLAPPAPPVAPRIAVARQGRPPGPGRGRRLPAGVGRRPALLALAAAAVIVVVIVAVALFANRRPAPPASSPVVPATTTPGAGSVPAPLDAALQRLQQAVQP